MSGFTLDPAAGDEHASGLARVVLAGKDPALFESLFDRLEAAVTSALEAVTLDASDDDTEAIISEVRRAGQRFVEAKLKKPSIENELKLAEVARTYAEAEARLAEREKTSEETRAQRIENARQELRLAVELLAVRAALREGADGGLTLDLAALGFLLPK